LVLFSHKTIDKIASRGIYIMNRILSFVSVVALLFQPYLTRANAGEILRHGTPTALQGEDIDLPQDLVSRLDNGKLRISLNALGVPSEVDSNRSSLIVRLIGDDEPKEQVAIDSSGVIEFENVTADKLHAVVINSPTAHAVVPVLPVSAQVAKDKGITAEQVRIPLMEASPQEILKNIASYTNSGTGQQAQSGTTYGPEEISQSVAPVFVIKLTASGVLNGRVVVPESEVFERLRFANITLINNGTPMAQTTSNESDGKFSFVNILPGRYGLIAAGPAGYAAYAIEVISATQTLADQSPTDSKLVSLNQPPVGDVAIVVLVPPSLMPDVVNYIERDYGFAPPVAGMAPSGPMGPMGGAGFPGGGFPGGGGGALGGAGGGLLGGQWGGLLALGALGGIAAAIASDDDDDQDNQVSPISR
jgi:hypothetical protein